MLTYVPNDPVVRTEPFKEWLARNGIPWTHTYRIDVEGDKATVHRYATNTEGKHFVDLATYTVVRLPALTLPIHSQPPQ